MSIHTAKEQVSGLATVSFNDDSNTGLHSSAADTVSLLAGGTTVVGGTPTTATLGVLTAGGLSLSTTSTAPRVLSVALTGSTTTATATFAIANPFAGGALITKVEVLATVASTGAATADIGVGAAATTGSDIILDGLTLNGVSANSVFSSLNATDDGTNGAMLQGRSTYWAPTEFVTFQNKADTTGFVGKMFVTCYPIL